MTESRRRSSTRANVLEALASLPERFGRYEVRGELGRGGMGIVYDAYDPELDRPVALKALYADPVDTEHESDSKTALRQLRFLAEIRATSRVFHPNLVTILDVGVDTTADGRTPYYVMERVEGQSLAEYADANARVGRNEALRIAEAIARGIAVVHRLGLVHRDLKPSNVLLPTDGEPKVADFGLCHSSGVALGTDESEYLYGSPHYLAPEQLDGGDVTPATDLYALGAILLTMLTGREPFRSSSLSSHFRRVREDAPDGLGQLDADVRAVVCELMAKDPGERPQDAASVEHTLRDLRERPAPRATEEDHGDGSRGRPRRALRLIIGGALAVALLGTGSWLVQSRNELVGLAVEVDRQWRQIENQRERQSELIPQLSEHLDRHVTYERETIDRILAHLREPASADVASALLVAQSSPTLQADRHFRMLAFEITGTINRISVERQRYDAAVALLNERLDQYPWKLVSSGLATGGYYQDRRGEAPAGSIQPRAAIGS